MTGTSIPLTDPAGSVERLAHLPGHNGGHRTMITGSAKAVTPFGPLTGRTAIYVEDQGEDSAVISFHCGHTPVILAVAGGNYFGLIRELIAHASAGQRARLEAELEDALGQVAS